LGVEHFGHAWSRIRDCLKKKKEKSMEENSRSANLEEKVGAQFSCNRFYKSVFVSEGSGSLL